MHRSIRSIIRKLKDNEGAYIYQAPSANAPATIWGYPVVEVEAFPASTDTAADTSFVLFGNLRKAAWVGVKAGGLSVMLSNQATVSEVGGESDLNLFEQDMSALRFVERIGYVEVLPLAVTKLTTGSSSV
jgi:HK97 family phage major capsid protein